MFSPKLTFASETGSEFAALSDYGGAPGSNNQLQDCSLRMLPYFK